MYSANYRVSVQFVDAAGKDDTTEKFVKGVCKRRFDTTKFDGLTSSQQPNVKTLVIHVQ